MAQSEHTSLWWPEERIKSTLDAKYIVSRLRPENIPRLFELPDWGEGLTSETYMEWILTKAGRVFLILNAIGIPDRIFALVDESCDDDDLPIAEHSVDLLHLSPNGEDVALETSFFHAQWRFLVRGITEGDHVVYTENEGVPVEAVHTNTSSGIHGHDDTVDRVVLAGSVCRVYLRTQVQVGGAPHFFSSHEVLAEIRNLKSLSHEHLISVFASYLKDDSVSVLFTGGTADRNLHSFLTDEPISFKRLDKEQRRQTLITWPHCLASAVCWLHACGHSHGAIRPSNIFIDANFHICLGQFQALDSLLTPPRVNDLEAYNYSAPERWTRPAAPMQQRSAQPAQTLLQSGGRTKRRQRPVRPALAPLNENRPVSADHTRPSSAASKGTVTRVGRTESPSRFSLAFSSSSSSSGASSAASSTHTDATAMSPQPMKQRISSFWSRRTKNTPSAPSILSISTSSSNQSTLASPNFHSPDSSTLFSTPPLSLRHSKSAHSLASSSSTRPTHSTESPTDPHNPADIFCLAATTLDILTVLHKRTLTSFSTHRSARNRSAGRGGGIADASFHLAKNAVQVQSWIALLEGDALKRCRRDRRSDRAFWAVPKMLIVIRSMLDFESVKRPLAKRVRRGFADAITRERGRGNTDGMGTLHCVKGKRENEEGGEEGGQKGYGGLEVIREIGAGRSAVSVSSTPLEVSKWSVCESVSEFDFGFGDAGSESESNVEGEEEDLSEFEEPEIRVEQVSPQLYLPELDMSITGIEELTFKT
ncbi:Serine/threonine-protein kinase 33 [Penicillium digitatum]|uniref:Serine-threonine/tyrosine-protein kinase catalytic domain-containing protein n=3 Tax=Penicillium digitatum TaxID=36651 RepID=K9GT58_PEND2|nr:hypothetical protein PDIP_23330 [Penicillium digitatum Pd1]EKV16276.1 hypothetical protein PDIG_21050 [Penicillium digitatum PHI26]EKV19445.1 hypothetical protein PDIP_23330 [Penicillium digitatum Pd1]KAG0153478.1 hypothetical protein PDIDSM_2130 [Penicillium digitatum]QQK47300.1 Serine/threonine-protein kinase 33 [Penicillium digitatum]